MPLATALTEFPSPEGKKLQEEVMLRCPFPLSEE